MFRRVKGCLPPSSPSPSLPLSLASDLVLGLGYTNFHYAMQISDNCWAALPCPGWAHLSLSAVFTPPSLFASLHSLLSPFSQLTLPLPQCCLSLYSLPALDMPQHTNVAPLSSASFPPLSQLSFSSSPSPFLCRLLLFPRHSTMQLSRFFRLFFTLLPDTAQPAALLRLPFSPFPPWAAPHHHSHALASKGS